jgi:hypothetical protein
MNMRALSLNYEVFMINVSSRWKNFTEVKIEFYSREINVFKWEDACERKIWIIFYPKVLSEVKEED